MELNQRVKRAVLALTLLGLCQRAVLTAADLRQSVNRNRAWSFQLGDVTGAAAAAFDAAQWKNVGLPHSFSLPYFAANDKFYVGYGWYRKHFDVPAAWTAQRAIPTMMGRTSARAADSSSDTGQIK